MLVGLLGLLGLVLRQCEIFSAVFTFRLTFYPQCDRDLMDKPCLFVFQLRASLSVIVFTLGYWCYLSYFSVFRAIRVIRFGWLLFLFGS